jgi:membrane-associated phospholipid phosphatase
VILNQKRGWTAGDLIAACTVVFAILTVLATLHSDALDWVDHKVGVIPQAISADQDWIGSFWLWVGRVTNPVNVLIAAAVLTLVLVALRQGRAAVFTVVAIGGTWLLNRGLKELVERDRPKWDDPVQVLHSYSFPSSHAATMTAAAAVAIVLAFQFIPTGWMRTSLIWTAVGLATLVGADRVFLGVHNVSDVIAAYMVATVVVLVSLVVASRPQRREWVAPPVPDSIRA